MDNALIQRSVMGLGEENSIFQVYIANRPPLDEYQSIDGVVPLHKEDIRSIADRTGNHWRKIFNVYSKLVFELLKSTSSNSFTRWQDYRDQRLLQKKSNTSLLFSPPDLTNLNSIHLVMGKGYADTLGLNSKAVKEMTDVDSNFSIWRQQKLIICPYFDYRQLSNIKIDTLVKLIMELKYSALVDDLIGE